MNKESKLICENDFFKTYLTSCSNAQYIISTHEQFAQLAVKKWIVFEEQKRWYIKSHQYKNEPIMDMGYEWVTYPISFGSLEGLITTFIEITDNFTYHFPFPKE